MPKLSRTSMSDFEFDFLTEDEIETQWEEDDLFMNFDMEEDHEEIDSSRSTPLVIERIEEMVLSFTSQLATLPAGSKVEISDESDESEETTNSRKVTKSSKKKDHSIKLELVDRKKVDAEGVVKTRTLRYPKKCRTGSLRPFAQLFKVLDIVHEATLSGVPATKRDIYYRDVGLFKSQKVVDMLVDDIAATFELDRSDLNIRSSAKGLICGSGLTIHLVSGEVIQCNNQEGTLIPAGEDIESFSVDEDLAWVLVVEKEAVFQTLCHLRISNSEGAAGRGLIITGKGYPDVATRHLVKSLADALPRTIPILGLVDGDPYGLDILSVYKYGSKSMHHENGKLAARRLKWLGLWTSELASLGVDKAQLLPITKHDEKKALDMLLRQDTPLPARWKKELQYILHSRRKAEIEILLGGLGSDHSQSRGLINSGPHALLLDYLSSKLTHFVKVAREKSSLIQ